MAYVVAFNSSISVTSTTQALDPSGAENLSFANTFTIHALSTNAAILYVSNKPGSGAGVGYPLEAGYDVIIENQTTGIFITGTASDKYGVVGS